MARELERRLPVHPYRDNSAGRRGGTPDTSTPPIPSRAISWARSSAVMAMPEVAGSSRAA
ncbi:hypothetical protein [Streptomyces parvus]|uniref:hypothetical protein n=1 Tax=Streptomyces parvus TaxID=66428 RepID=UPI0035E04131